MVSEAWFKITAECSSWLIDADTVIVADALGASDGMLHVTVRLPASIAALPTIGVLSEPLTKVVSRGSGSTTCRLVAGVAP